MPNDVYPPVGRCVCCGDTTPPLGREHIIPFAFAGKLILPEASCKRCERIINQQIETPVSSQEWGSFRARCGGCGRHREIEPGRNPFLGMSKSFDVDVVGQKSGAARLP
jgi:HNH endonuclease